MSANQLSDIIGQLDKAIFRILKIMKFIDWKENGNYQYLENTGRVRLANGCLPDGAKVRFVADGDIGTVIVGNQQRSLVSYSAPYDSGCISQRDWFPNSDLQIEVQ